MVDISEFTSGVEGIRIVKVLALRILYVHMLTVLSIFRL